MADTDKIRKAVPEDLPQISSALTRAFFDDPLFAWSLSDEDRRQRLLPEFFALFTSAFLRHKETYTTRGDVVAAALWAPPGAIPVSGEDAEELGRQVEELAGPDAPRFLGVNKLFDDHHPHGSYWYLQFMGVAPDWQGQGIGSALMAPVLERCDREGMRAYLDATSERNKRLYERHGFEAEEPSLPQEGRPCGRCGDSQLRIGSNFWCWPWDWRRRARRHRFVTVNHGHSRTSDLQAPYNRCAATRMVRMGSP